MAAITKRFSGRSLTWQVKVRRKGYPKINRSFDHHAEAEAWAATVESQMARGVFTDRRREESMTIREGLELYKRDITPGKRGRIAEQYLVEALAKLWIADYTFATLRALDVARFRDDLRKKGNSNSTVLRKLHLLSHLFKVARTEWGMETLSNPVEAVRKPSPNRGRTRRLLPGEEQELLSRAAVYGGFIGPVMVLAIETAMRRAEIAELRWQDVDLKRRIIHLDMTKNGERRDIPLSTLALATLRALPRRINGEVFGVRPDAITQAFERLTGADKKRSNGLRGREPLSDLRFHDLRHEAISRMFEKGLNPMQVATISGHKTLQMLKRYTQLRAEDLVALLG